MTIEIVKFVSGLYLAMIWVMLDYIVHCIIGNWLSLIEILVIFIMLLHLSTIVVCILIFCIIDVLRVLVLFSRNLLSFIEVVAHFCIDCIPSITQLLFVPFLNYFFMSNQQSQSRVSKKKNNFLLSEVITMLHDLSHFI